MGIYRNPYEDFPARCQELWRRLDRAKETADRDLSVTAMLMVAMAGFASPWEFLKHDNIGAYVDRKSHPAFDDVSEKEYKLALCRVKSNISMKVSGASLFASKGKTTWRFGHCINMNDVRPLAEHIWNASQKIPAEANKVSQDEKTAKSVLNVIRNALAHGNVCAFMGRSNEIDRMVFFSEDIKWDGKVRNAVGWHVATVTVEGFRDFLNNWFALIREPRNFLVLSAALDEQYELLAA